MKRVINPDDADCDRGEINIRYVDYHEGEIFEPSVDVDYSECETNRVHVTSCPVRSKGSV